MRLKSAALLWPMLLTGCVSATDSALTGPPEAGLESGRISPITLADMTAFALVDTREGVHEPTPMSVEKTADILSTFDVVFLGEMHRHPGNHLAQMQLFRAIHERAPETALSMEHFERDVQPVVDKYLAGDIGEAPFISDARAWANYRTSYRPLVEYAKEHGLTVIAANAPEDVVRCVGLEGAAFLERMSPDQRRWVAAILNTGPGAYRDKFMGFVQGDAAHGGDPDAAKEDGEDATPQPPSEGAMRSYAAQVTRDDTMAESIADYLTAHPGHKVVHLNGSFHSNTFLGTVERVQMRLPDAKIAVVSPYTVKSGEAAAFDEEDMTLGTFLLVLRELPEAYASDEEMSAAIKRQMAAREERVCKL